jgi:hypothetical protein
MFSYSYPESHNTWDYDPTGLSYPWVETDSVTLTDEDFIVIDSTMGFAQLTASRESDGSLPDVDFLNLLAESDLVDAGKDVGLAYCGTAPDMGAFESDIVPNSSNYYPTVEITSPINNTLITQETVVLTAEASDDDSIEKVVFYYNDTVMIGEVYSSPWEMSWEPGDDSYYTLRAKATDNEGAVSTSKRIAVYGEFISSIENSDIKNSTECFAYPNPTQGSFTLDFGTVITSAKVSITNITGKIVQQQMVYNTQSAFFDINKGTGIYLIQIQQQSEIELLKIVVN